VSPKALLRTLVVLEFSLAILAGAVSWATESSLPEPLRAYVQAQAEREWPDRYLVMLAAIGGPLLLAYVVASVGLFLFWRPARPLYLVTVIGGVLLTPALGPYVDSGWGEMLGAVGGMVTGAILALIYFSPLKELYEGGSTASASAVSDVEPSQSGRGE